MLTDLEKTIREYLPQVIHMSLATCNGKQPWVCEVHFVYDEDLNLYFRSTKQRRHSQEIAQNPLIAGNIIKQHTIDQKPRGVYFEGKAKLLTSIGDQDPAYLLYCERFGTGPSILKEAQTPTGHKFYKITVEKFYVFDSQESSPSHKYELEWNS